MKRNPSKILLCVDFIFTKNSQLDFLLNYEVSKVHTEFVENFIST